MKNELTEKDLALMQQELDYRRLELRPQLIEAVKTARAFGDLSENFEYKAAKQEKNRNDSRCRYLENMIKSAVVISDCSRIGVVGLYDRVTLHIEEDDEDVTVQVVTTMRQDALNGLISKESPVGKAVIGHRAGDRVLAQMENGKSFYIQILSIEKGTDDGSIPIGSF